nr:hypothetical protein BaRGS_034669 [Batillaria attramentaria]
MEVDLSDNIKKDDIIFYSVLYSSVTVVFGMAVLSKFLTNEFRFGCDSGFGYALVQKLDSIGMRVFAGFLDVDGLGAMELRDKCSRRLVCMQLDVTKRKDIDAAVAAVQEAVGEEGLWGLVNNAGVWYFSELEMTSEKVMRRVMDVNLFVGV